MLDVSNLRIYLTSVLQEFKKTFDVFTHGLFRDFPWQKMVVVAGGGGVIASLLAEAGNSENAIKDQIKKLGFDSAYLDLYFLGALDAKTISDKVRIRYSFFFCSRMTIKNYIFKQK